MKYHLITLCFLCCTLLGFSQKESNINFTIRNLGVNVNGHFEVFSITPQFKNNELVNLSASITTASIKTGIDIRDEHLLDEDYFYVKAHPFISLKSTDITKQEDNTYKVKVNLTIKGKTKTISIPIQINKVDNSYKITSFFEINRRDFNVGGGGFILSKTVNTAIVYYHTL